MSDSSRVTGGTPLPGLLTVLFVGLKLGHVIDWSWWWVVSPLWISAAFGVALLVVAGIITAAVDK